MLNHPPVHFQLLDIVRMCDHIKLFLYGFKQNHDTGHLDSAARAAGARSDKHQQHQDRPGKRRPQIKIRRGKSGRCDDRSHLERRMTQRFPYI